MYVKVLFLLINNFIYVHNILYQFYTIAMHVLSLPIDYYIVDITICHLAQQICEHIPDETIVWDMTHYHMQSCYRLFLICNNTMTHHLLQSLVD